MGADVVYAAAGIPSLFSSAAALLAASPQALLLLCHTARSVSEEAIIEMAGLQQLVPTPWPAEIAASASTIGVSPQSAMRLLSFKRRPGDVLCQDGCARLT